VAIARDDDPVFETRNLPGSYRICYRLLVFTRKIMTKGRSARPALERVPTDVMPTDVRHESPRVQADVLYTDQTWRMVTILAQASSRIGRAVLVGWPDGSQDWRLYDEQLIRPPARAGNQGYGQSRCTVPIGRPARWGRSSHPGYHQLTPPRWKPILSALGKPTGAIITAMAVTATGVATVAAFKYVSQVRIVRHGSPVKIDSVKVLRVGSQGGTFVFKSAFVPSRSELASLNRLQGDTPEYAAWFKDRGGVDPFSSNVQIVVEGNANRTAWITNITVVKSCEAPLAGSLFSSEPAGGGPPPSLSVNFNLDSPQPIAETVGDKTYFSTYTIPLNPGQVRVIEVTASTLHYYCRYSLQLTVLTGSHSITEDVTNNGRPFEVTGLIPAARYRVLYAGGIDSPRPPRFVRESLTEQGEWEFQVGEHWLLIKRAKHG
jgi:hypothetical protein